ncbi:hypothetical protein RF55_24013, partial [Lasius niger]
MFRNVSFGDGHITNPYVNLGN